MEAEIKIIEKLNCITNLPTLPLVMQKVSAAVRDPNMDARKLAAIMEDDPAIMARVLKMVNSAFYAGEAEITGVQQAIARMGMNVIHNLALSTSVFSAFGQSADDSFDRKEFWRHSISVGIGACVIADRAKAALNKKPSKETLRLAGLLHDIGKIVMDQYFHDDFIKALARTRSESVPLWPVETETLGADHARIGAWLGVKWRMKDELVQVVRWHHEPESVVAEHLEITALIHIANYICNRQKIGDGGDTAAPTFVQALWKRLGLSVSDISEIVDQIAEESRKSEILLSFV